MGKDRLMEYDDNGFVRDTTKQLSFKTKMTPEQLKAGTPVLFENKVIGVVTGSHFDPVTGSLEVDVTAKLPDPIPFISVSVSVGNPFTTVDVLPEKASPGYPFDDAPDLAPLVLPDLQGFTKLLPDYEQEALAQMLLDVTVDPFALREV